MRSSDDGSAAPEAVRLVDSKRDSDGHWPLENPHPGRLHFAIDDGAGKPSRWNTLRAMRVLSAFADVAALQTA